MTELLTRKFQVMDQYEFGEERNQFATYTKIQRKGLVGFGIGLIDRAIQKNVPNMEGLQILEVGGVPENILNTSTDHFFGSAMKFWICTQDYPTQLFFLNSEEEELYSRKETWRK